MTTMPYEQWVTLNYNEALHAVTFAARCKLHAEAKDWHAKGGQTWDAWQEPIFGGIVEIAFGKLYDIHHPMPYGPGEPDYIIDGVKIEVRGTRYGEGHLLVKKKDDANSLYVLGTLLNNFSVRFVGSMWGYEAMTEENWLRSVDDLGFREPCWAVRQEDLGPLPKKAPPAIDEGRGGADGVVSRTI